MNLDISKLIFLLLLLLCILFITFDNKRLRCISLPTMFGKLRFEAYVLKKQILKKNKYYLYPVEIFSCLTLLSVRESIGTHFNTKPKTKYCVSKY